MVFETFPQKILELNQSLEVEFEATSLMHMMRMASFVEWDIFSF